MNKLYSRLLPSLALTVALSGLSCATLRAAQRTHAPKTATLLHASSLVAPVAPQAVTTTPLTAVLNSAEQQPSPECFATGVVGLTVRGGQLPYRFSLVAAPNGIPLGEFTSNRVTQIGDNVRLFYLFAGNYTVRVTDAAGATVDVQTTVSGQNLYTVTNATCDNNGIVNFHIPTTGDYHDFKYELIDAQGQTVGVRTSDDLIGGLAPGRYTAKIEGKRRGTEHDIFTCNLQGIVVTSDYQRLQFSENRGGTQGAYGGCGTGTLAMNVSGGRLPRTFSFEAAPAGVKLGELSSSQYTLSNSGALTLKDLPPGAYTVRATDACGYSVRVQTEIPLRTAAPVMANESSGAFASTTPYAGINDQMQCHQIIMWYQPSTETLNNAELMADIRAGKWQMSVAPEGKTPTESQWQQVPYFGSSGGNYFLMDLGEGEKMSDYYGKNLTVRFRLAGCDAAARSVNIALPERRGLDVGYGTVACGQYRITVGNTLWAGQSDRIYCYPLTINLYETNRNGRRIASETMQNRRTIMNVGAGDLQYEKDYFLEVIDAGGNIVQTETINRRNDQMDGWTVDKYITCERDGWYMIWGWNRWRGCDYEAYIDKLENGNWINVATQKFSSTVTLNQSPKLEFGVQYRIRKFQWERDGLGYTYTAGIGTMERPTAEVSALYYNCEPGKGNIRITLTNQQPGKEQFVTLRQGTRVIYSGKVSSNTIDVNDVIMPDGQYTLVIDEPGCASYEVPIDWKDFLSIKDFKFTTGLDCQNLQIIPHGKFMVYGKEQEAWFSIIQGPAGGYTSQRVREGEPITITREGDYKLAMHFSITGCDYDTRWITYSRDAVGLDPKESYAFACSGTEVGYIYVKGRGGVGPYTYELYKGKKKADGGEKVEVPLQTDSRGRQFFHTGHVGETFYVYTKDMCNKDEGVNELIMVDIQSLQVGNTLDAELCAGENIRLIGMPLFDHEWYRAIDEGGNVYEETPFSRERDPIIRNAKVSDGGKNKYKLVVIPPQCNTRPKDGFVTVNVRSCYSPLNPQLMNKGQRAE